ncbi:MAG: hypothetical protein KAR12_18185, partial [Methylococcales bacterium]|nr:hypothetical protein [Methylococcales bacterium]
MSLLNQVLQDLEKRNAENIPEHQPLSKGKAITLNQGRSYYFPFAILCIIGIIAIIVFNTQKTPGTLEERNIVKQSLAIPAPNNILKKTLLKNPSIPKVVRSKPKTQAAKKNHNNKQETEPGISNKQKTIKKKPEHQTVKKLSNEQKAEQYFSLAKQQQSNSDKQKNLELAIQINPQHINARLLLTNMLLQQGLTLQAAILLDQSLMLFPQTLQFITLRSQLFLQKKQAQNALNILHHIDKNQVQDETYLSLLAAAYQQNNDNLNSLTSYQKLVKINPHKAEYWLGLAIAQEKQGHPLLALNAYQQALNKNTLKPVIV